jgi:hypothetical protein
MKYGDTSTTKATELNARIPVARTDNQTPPLISTPMTNTTWWIMSNLNIPDHNKAQNAVLQIVTAAREGDFHLASKIVAEFEAVHGSILPMFMSSIALIESVISTVSQAMDIPPDKLFAGICLGLSVKQIEAQQERDQQ